MPGNPEPVEDLRYRLRRAPLERVLCQARWEQLSLFSPSSVAGIASQLAGIIGDIYPFGQSQQEMQITITPAGVTQRPGDTVHRFKSADHKWTATLSHLFIALETIQYTDHVDFVERFDQLYRALLTIIQIPSLTRLGYRYTNRLSGSDDLSKVAEYFAPGILGGLAGEEPEVAQMICETLRQEGSKYLMVRSALLPAGAVIDPTLAVMTERSWIIDLDSFDESPGIAIESIHGSAIDLSAMGSQHFHKLLTPEGLERFK